MTDTINPASPPGHEPSGRVSAVSELLQEFVDGRASAGGFGPLQTGFHPLDTILGGGLLPGELFLVGGRPGVGKTLSSLQWSRSFASQGRSVVYVCFEHDEHTLLTRLLVQELAVVAPDMNATEQLQARSVVRRLMLGLIPLDEALTQSSSIRAAFESLHEHAPALHLYRASTQRSDLGWISRLAEDHLDRGDALIVDYVQKVPVPGASALSERIYRSTEGLKEIATERALNVIALSAADQVGIGQDRLTLDHLRGADALAHECDIGLILNEKVTATSTRHLDFDLTQIDAAKRHTVFSVEKNRRGETDVHMEFAKDFSSYRFDPKGGFVTESLVGQ